MWSGIDKSRRAVVPADLPPAPPGRSATLAASSHGPVPEGLLPGAVTGAVLAVWALLSGAPGWALVVALAGGGLGSLWLHLYEDRQWVGDDWIANRGLFPTLVFDVADIATVDVPSTDVGPTELVVSHRDGSLIRIDLGQLYANRAFGDAVMALVQRAGWRGADVRPGVGRLMDDLGRRTS